MKESFASKMRKVGVFFFKVGVTESEYDNPGVSTVEVGDVRKLHLLPRAQSTQKRSQMLYRPFLTGFVSEAAKHED
jgi:hypothetical protein